MKVEIHHSPQIFESLRAEWNALLRQSASDTLFLTWEFQKTWWDHFGAGHELHVLSARDEAGRLIAIGPLYGERNEAKHYVLRFIGGTEVADYLDIFVLRGHEHEVFKEIFDALCEADDCPWNLLDLHNVPASSSLLAAFSALGEQRGFHVHSRIEDVCPVIHLPSTFEAYLESLDKKQRHEVRRKMRKAYADADVKWYIIDSHGELPVAVDNFVELQQRSKLNKGEFMTPLMANFFNALATRAHEAGWLELSFIEMNGQRAATYLNFIYNGNTLVYNSGYDPQAYAALSPGIVLLAHLIEHSILQGRKQFDFLQGNEAYKYRMGAHDTQIYHLEIQRN